MPDQTSPVGDNFPMSTYTEGDLVIIDGRRWRVARISDDGRPSVRLVRMPTYTRIGTTVYADVLDQIGTRVPADRPAPIRDLTTDLRQLLAAATPGPFTVSDDTGALANLQSLHRLTPGKDGWRERVASNMRSADAALIGGVLNALPVLLDALDEAEEASARAAELEAHQQPRTIQHRLGVVDALPPGSQIVDDDGVPALKVSDFDPGVTDGDGYHSDDLRSELLARLATPHATARTEADIQSDIRLLLLGKEFEARAAIDRVRKLHQPENGCDNPVHTVPDATCPQCCDYCQCCGEAMPCATIRAIDGEDQRFPTAKAGGFTGGVR